MTNLTRARVSVAFHADCVAQQDLHRTESLYSALTLNWEHYETAVDYVSATASPNVVFSANLDMVPGWGHDPADWTALVQARARGVGVIIRDVTTTVGEGHRHIATLATATARALDLPLDPVAAWTNLRNAIGESISLDDAVAAMPDWLDFGYEYVVYATDLNTLYNGPGVDVVVCRTRHKQTAQDAAAMLSDHTTATWIDVQVEAEDPTAQRRADAASRRIDPHSLHVGDRVMLWMYTRESIINMDYVVRVVTITEITPRDIYSTRGERANPVIGWAADPAVESDWYTRTNGDREPMAQCDAGYVVAVLERAPWRTGVRLPHNVYAARGRNGDSLFDLKYYITHRAGGCVATHPYQLAQAILGARPHLDVPERLDADRFWAAWRKAQTPGWRGTYVWSWPKGVVTAHRGKTSHDREHWINLKAFRRWLLRVYPTLLKTSATIRAEGIELAKFEEDMYVRDMEATYGSRMDDLADSSHMEDDMKNGGYDETDDFEPIDDSFSALAGDYE